MGGATSFRALCVCGRARFSRARPQGARPQRITRRRHDVADQFRPARKRPADRDRGALCFPHRARLHLLVELVAGTPPPLACLDGAVDFSRARAAGERSARFAFLLRRRVCCSLAGQSPASTLELAASRRDSLDARDLRGLGGSLFSNDASSARGGGLVAAVFRATIGGRFQARRLAAQHPARHRLFAAMGDSLSLRPLRRSR